MDTLADLLVVLILVAVIGIALWPPHAHHYRYMIGSTEHRGKRYEIYRCKCGASIRKRP